MGTAKTPSRTPESPFQSGWAPVLIWIIGCCASGPAEPLNGPPIGPYILPPSTSGNDLVPRSNPIDTSGDLLMTGNVAAGMQFRGRVPYRGATDLRTSLGSTYLDGFLRHTQGAPDRDLRFGGTLPFYSPSATVSRMVAGSTDLFAPSKSWGWLLPGGGEAEGSEPIARLAWPLSLGTAEKAGSALGRYPWTEAETARSPVTVQSVAPEPVLLGLPFLPRTPDGTAPGYLFRTGLEGGGLEGRAVPERPSDPCGSDVGFSVQGASSKRERVFLPVGTLDGFWQIRYEECMETARARLQEGHPQRAVDAYTLAILYKPSDTLALAGKSHALFACGEFLSSALFLERTLGICPDYAGIPVDLAQWTGGKEVLRTRVEEANRYLKQNESKELRLILAYAYYRMGELHTARDILAKAGDARPRSALHVLRQVVGRALQGKSD